MWWPLLLLLLRPATAFCPAGCQCDNTLLAVSCVQTELEVMPMTLNPSIRTLILKYNNFHSVDASFNFYPELELVDLSSNQLGERTFSGLGRLQSLTLAANLLDNPPNRAFR